jgi:two-component system chemotaxis response regulator CheB
MFQLVVVAASAGGLSALTTVLARLSRDFPVPLAVVQHIDPHRASHMAEILNRKSPLVVKEAVAHEQLLAGTVYVAPPGQHLMVTPGHRVRLTRTEPVHFLRPAADLLFASAANAFDHVIGVVLTGTGRDGADGAFLIRNAGGVVIAQNEESSAFFGMPHAAIAAGAVDYVLPLDQIAGALTDLTRTEGT